MNKEIEELALELIDMLGVALYFAGVEKKNIREAIDLYIQSIDDEDDSQYTQDEIISLINSLKQKHPQLFRNA